MGAGFLDLFRRGRAGTILFAILAVGILAAAARAEDGQQQGGTAPPANKSSDLEGLLNLDIDQLSKVDVRPTVMSTEVSTVERRESTVGQTPAAVYVVTNEMIRRCGARNIPEVLRTVPGVEVARINASAWAISIRGDNARFANKLLVQIDGVAIYNPTHGGVFWERDYVMLEDVERIEVIRGPGASVWGVNAVNGIINIITKSSKDSKGIYADGGGGNEHRQFGDFRVGGQSGDFHWRVYGMSMEDGLGYAQPPAIAADNPSMNQGGFRADWTPTRQDTFTIQGDFYKGLDYQNGSYVPPATVTPPMNCSTSTFLTRWARKIDDETDWTLQLYYYNPFAVGQNRNNSTIFDTDFQYHFKRDRHDVVCGCGYRNCDEEFIGGGTMAIIDSEQIPNYLIQDTITLVEDRFFLTLGSKFDHNSVTTFEFQPTVRAMWTPNKETSIWAAISHAARTPALQERMFFTPNAEDLMAYEMGIRRQPNEKFFWDLAVFDNRYSGLLGWNSPFVYQNVGNANTYGFECSSTYTMNSRWHLTGSYSFLIENYQWAPGYSPENPDGSAPRNQFYLQSGWDLGKDVTFDVMFRYVDSLVIGVPSYFANDVRVAWRPARHLELSLVGQNLLAGKHYEFISSSIATPTEIGPAVYGMVTWRY